MTDESHQTRAAGCSCQALNCPQCSSAETIEPVITRATGMIRRARLTEAELDVCMQVGLHAVYAARRLAANQFRDKLHRTTQTLLAFNEYQELLKERRAPDA